MFGWGIHLDSKELIFLFYSVDYSSSIFPFKILLIGVVTMSGWKILGSDLYGRGKPELNIYVSLISVVLNIILNILWIPKIGILGAAWATSISYTFSFVAIAIVYCKVSGNKIWNVILFQKSDFNIYKNIFRKLKNGNPGKVIQ